MNMTVTLKKVPAPLNTTRIAQMDINLLENACIHYTCISKDIKI